MRSFFFPAVITAMLSLSSSVVAQHNALKIPDTLSGTTFNLTMQNGTTQFWPGVNTATKGFNGSFLGPTLLLRKGDFITLNVTNQIGEETTVHWHGMHVAPMDDGGPHTVIPANTVWSPDFTVLDRATTFWYHPHLHHKTMDQVLDGLAGMIIVRDSEEAALSLPRRYGVDDFPLVIQDKSFAGGGIQHIPLGDSMMVNGTMRPFLNVPANVIRFRLLNGSAERTYQLGFTDNRAFSMIGSDGGLLTAPAALTRLKLSPGERAEILVNLTGASGSSFYLRSFSSELPSSVLGGPAAGPGPASPLNGTNFNILQLRVGAADAEGKTDIPQQLVSLTRTPAAQAVKTRTKRFLNPTGPGQPFTINGLTFNMAVVNDMVTLGDTEIWELKNESRVAHPFHIHDIQFFILDRNGAAPPVHEQGLKDVVLVDANETVRFITRFEDFADPETPYMYHCHILVHEDDGMMGQFTVVEPTVSIEETRHPESPYLLQTYPNPFNPSAAVTFDLPTAANIELGVYAINGMRMALLASGKHAAGQHRVSMQAEGWASGTYVVRLRVDGKTTVSKKITLVK